MTKTAREAALKRALEKLRHCQHGCCDGNCPHNRKYREVLRAEGLMEMEDGQRQLAVLDKRLRIVWLVSLAVAIAGAAALLAKLV